MVVGSWSVNYFEWELFRWTGLAKKEVYLGKSTVPCQIKGFKLAGLSCKSSSNFVAWEHFSLLWLNVAILQHQVHVHVVISTIFPEKAKPLIQNFWENNKNNPYVLLCPHVPLQPLPWRHMWRYIPSAAHPQPSSCPFFTFTCGDTCPPWTILLFEP